MKVGRKVLAFVSSSLLLCPGMVIAQGSPQDNNHGQQGGPPSGNGYRPGSGGQGDHGNSGNRGPENSSGNRGDNGSYGRPGGGTQGNNGQGGTNQGHPGNSYTNGRPTGNNYGNSNAGGRPGYNGGPGGYNNQGQGNFGPGGGGYVQHSDWRRGHRMSRNDWNRGQQIDYHRYHLNAPPRGYQWRQVDGNYVLAAVATGLIASVVIASTVR